MRHAVGCAVGCRCAAAAGGGGEGFGGERRQDRGGGRRRAEDVRAAEQLLPLLDADDDDAEPHAGEGRAAVPEGLADAVVGADAQRAVRRRRRVLRLRVRAGTGAEPAQGGVARGPAAVLPELHGQHGVVARQGAVAERAEAAPLVGVRDVGRRGLAVAVVLGLGAPADAEPGRGRCASRARASTMSSVPGSECGSSSTVGHRGHGW